MTAAAQPDPEYVAFRDSLIPVASAVADERHPAPSNPTHEERRAHSERWDAEYHRAMERLVREHRDGQPS